MKKMEDSDAVEYSKFIEREHIDPNPPSECTTTLVTGHLFKLRDYDKGFEPENRKELMTCAMSVQSETDRQLIEANKGKCDPFMPLRLFDPNKTFYLNQYSMQDTTNKYFNDSGIPRRLLKQDFANMDPIQLEKAYSQSPTSAQSFEQEIIDQKDKLEDPDFEYFNFIGNEFVDYKRRRELEKEEPFIYTYYTTSTVYGCEHYYRNAFPICSTCGKIVRCRFCHDDEIYDHRFNRSETKYMYCLLCKKIGPIGTHCQHCKQEVSKICCPICKTLCMIGEDVKPAYHCEKCGVCRVGLAENSVHCDKCGTCYDIKSQKTHVCADPNCICPIC